MLIFWKRITLKRSLNESFDLLDLVSAGNHHTDSRVRVARADFSASHPHNPGISWDFSLLLGATPLDRQMSADRYQEQSPLA